MGLHLPKIRLDSHSLGNLAKNFSPVAGAVIGGPLGLLAAGALSSGGDLARGKNVSVTNALTNATLAGGLGAAKGALSSGGFLGGPGYTAGDVAKGAVENTGSALKSAAGGALNFSEAHPEAASRGLSAIGNLATSGSENRLRDAQAAQLETQTGKSQFELEREKALQGDPAYADLFSSLGMKLGGNLSGNVAPNPYTARS